MNADLMQDRRKLEKQFQLRINALMRKNTFRCTDMDAVHIFIFLK